MFENPPPNLPTPPLGNEPNAPSQPPQVPVSPSIPPIPVKPKPGPEPDDIFAGTEPASSSPPLTGVNPLVSSLSPAPSSSESSPGVIPPLKTTSPAPTPINTPSRLPADYVSSGRSFSGRRTAMAIVSVVVIGGLGFAGYYFRDSLLGTSGETVDNTDTTTDTTEPTDDTANTTTDTNTATDASTTTEPVIITPPEPSVVNPTGDNDSDNLTNEQEFRLGTDPNNYDSDADGIFDGEEVNLFRTNPLNADTDGDSYTDGTEVKNGYNPNGSGRLYNVQTNQ